MAEESVAMEPQPPLSVVVEDPEGNVSVADAQSDSFTSTQSHDTPEPSAKGNKRKVRSSRPSRKRPKLEQLLKSPFEGTESNPELLQKRTELFPERPGITYELKAQVEVKWGRNGVDDWYPARFIGFDASGQLQVHFNNWTSRYDEWIEAKSDRLRPFSSDTPALETPEPEKKNTFEVDDFVMARWFSSSIRQPAKVLSVDGENLTLLYGDGLQKSVKATAVLPITDAQMAKVEKIGFGGQLEIPFDEAAAARAIKPLAYMTYSRKKRSGEGDRSTSAQSSSSLDRSVELSPVVPPAVVQDLPAATSTPVEVENPVSDVSSSKRRRKPKTFSAEFETGTIHRVKKTPAVAHHLDAIVDAVVSADTLVAKSNVSEATPADVHVPPTEPDVKSPEPKLPRPVQASPTRALSIKRTCVTDRQSQAASVSKKLAVNLSPPPAPKSATLSGEKSSTQQSCEAAKNHIIETDPAAVNPESLQHPILKELSKFGSWKKLPEKSPRPQSSTDSNRKEDPNPLPLATESKLSIETIVAPPVVEQQDESGVTQEAEVGPKRNIPHSSQRRHPEKPKSVSRGEVKESTPGQQHFLLSLKPPPDGNLTNSSSNTVAADTKGSFAVSKEGTKGSDNNNSASVGEKRLKPWRQPSIEKRSKFADPEYLKSQSWYNSQVTEWLGIDSSDIRMFCTVCQKRLSLAKEQNSDSTLPGPNALLPETQMKMQVDLFATSGFRFDKIRMNLVSGYVGNHQNEPHHKDAVAFMKALETGVASESIVEAIPIEEPIVESTPLVSAVPDSVSLAVEEIKEPVAVVEQSQPEQIQKTSFDESNAEVFAGIEVENETPEPPPCDVATADPQKRRWIRKLSKTGGKKSAATPKSPEDVNSVSLPIAMESEPPAKKKTKLKAVRSPTLSEVKQKQEKVKKTLEDWRTGREDWLVFEKGLVKCRVCSYYATEAQQNGPMVRGVTVNRVSMVKDHDLKRQHQKNVEKYYIEVLNANPPLITHAPDVPGGLTEFSQQDELKCPEPGCTRTFRRQKNLDEHVKHSHKPDGTLESTPKPLPKPKAAKKQTPITPVERTLVFPQSDDEDYEPIKCLCGVQSIYGLMLECSICKTKQHGSCLGILEDTDIPKDYVCYTCTRPVGGRHRRRRHLADFARLAPSRFPEPLIGVVTGTLDLAARQHKLHKEIVAEKYVPNGSGGEVFSGSMEELDRQLALLQDHEREVEMLEKSWKDFTGDDFDTDDIPQMRQRLSHLQSDISTVASLASRFLVKP